MSDFTYSWDFETWPSNEKGTIRSRWSTNSILFRIQMNNWEHSNESATLSEKIIIILFTHSMHRFDDIKEYFIVRIKISTKLFYYWQLVTGVWCTGHGREKNTIIHFSPFSAFMSLKWTRIRVSSIHWIVRSAILAREVECITRRRRRRLSSKIVVWTWVFICKCHTSNHIFFAICCACMLILNDTWMDKKCFDNIVCVWTIIVRTHRICSAKRLKSTTKTHCAHTFHLNFYSSYAGFLLG